MITNNDIRRFLGMKPIDNKFKITQVDSLGVNKNTLMFINKGVPDIYHYDIFSKDCVYIIDESYPYTTPIDNDFIRVKNPKFVFCMIVAHFNFKSAYQIRNRKRIVTKGKNCQIDSGVILGGTDFSPVVGYSPDELVQFPQMGGVLLGDNVVIKYNSMVGKGTFGYTVIKDNTMIDYGCQIGHNCIIGKSCIIAAGTIIGGSTCVGDNTVIGIGAKIRNGLHIGKNVSIGMGSVVVKDIPDNAVVVGNPARIIDHKPIFDEEGLK